MEKEFKHILKGAATITLMTIAASFIGFFIRMLLARKLSVEDFGLFYAVLGFLGPIAFLKSLGVNKAVTKFTPEFRINGEWGKIKESINWAVIVSLGTSVITAGTVYFLTD